MELKTKKDTSANLVFQKNETNVLSGAEMVIQSLLEENVETVFGYPGGAIMPVYDALYNYLEDINHVLTRHEQGAIHAAQGYARVSGKTGVVFSTSGPGATNLITGLADAMIDSTPLVCITGQVAAPLLGTDAFQETDVIGISMPVTKWNAQVTKAEDIPQVMAKAFYIAASGRPGPVLIDITKDAQFEKSDFYYKKCTSIRSYRPKPILNKSALQEATQLLNESEKPLLLIGQGVILSQAEQAVLKLAEKANIPIASTLLGLGAVPYQHPLYVGMVGMHGDYAPNVKINECDLLLAVGMRFDDRVTGDVNRYAKQAKIIHIDIDKAELNKIVKTDVAIHADAKKALQEMYSYTKENHHPLWLQEFKEAKDFGEEKLNPQQPNDGCSMKMDQVIKELTQLTDGSGVIVTDVGQHQMIAARNYEFKNTRSHLTSGGLGTMGFALPAAIGAQLGNPQKEVIAVIGDGGFQMTLQELGTLMQENLNLKVIVLNNSFLGMVRQWQQLFFERRYSFTQIQSPDFTILAKSYGMEAESIRSSRDLKSALQRMLDFGGAYLLEIKVEKEANVFPMVPSGASVSEIRLQ